MPTTDSRPLLDKERIDARLRAGLEWVLRSMAATGQQGSAAYYHLWRGWSPAYPETTGYLIETLFDLGDYLHEPLAAEKAVACADWLCSLQCPDGSIPCELGGTGRSYIFDQGQILFGLLAAHRHTQDKKYLYHLHLSAEWLIKQFDQKAGTWTTYNFLPGYAPAYYLRVIWALLAANRLLQQAEIESAMRRALEHYQAQIRPNFTVTDWAFRPGEAAYTHTIAYTIRGMLESGLLLEESRPVENARKIADQLMKLHCEKGKIAGAYDEHWQGNYGFVCITGQAQLSIIYHRLYQITGHESYRSFGNTLLFQILPAQSLQKWSPFYGGIPGSSPVSGPYQRFKWINWGVKFFLDALLAQSTVK